MDILYNSCRKINYRSVIAVGFDIILFAFLIISFILWINFLTSMSMSVSSLPFTDLLGQDAEQLDVLYAYLFNLLISIIGGLLLIYLMFIVMFTYFKGLSWCWLYGKKLTFKLFLKMLAMNFILSLTLLVPLISFIIQKRGMIDLYRGRLIILMVCAMFIFIFLYNLMYFYLIQTRAFSEAVKKTLAFKHIEKIIPYYIGFFAIIAVVIFLTRMLMIPINILVLSIAFVILFAFARIFFSCLLEKYLA